MNIKKINFNLDCSDMSDQICLHGIRQGDSNSVQFVIKLTDNEEAFSFENDNQILLYGLKPDGTKLCNSCELDDEGNVIYTLHTQDTSAAGKVQYQLVVSELIDGTLRKIASPSFSCFVESKLFYPDYKALDEKPDDWEDSFNSYYELVDGIYMKLNKTEAPDFVSGSFYSCDGVIESTDEFSALTTALYQAEEYTEKYADVEKRVSSAETKVDEFVVDTDRIVDKAVTSDKIANGAVNGKHIASGTICDDLIPDGAIGEWHIADGAVTVDKLSDEVKEKLSSSTSGSGEDGLSAYEVAVNNGYEGTEDEWLESLKGEDGRSVTNAFILDSGELVIEFSDDEGLILDKVVPVKGTDYFTEDDKTELVEEVTALVNSDGIPDYWVEHIDSKIATINELHRHYGKDCFSFVFMTDMHYPSNLGKISPLLAKKIMDEASVKFAICAGDMQTRGCHSKRDLVLQENLEITEMLKPLEGRLLIAEGNHDGGYGYLDRDEDGTYSNSYSDGTVKPVSERETYVNNLTPQELHQHIYRKVGVVGNVHFDESGTAYYIDDTSNNVRYIGLNTQCNDYEEEENGTSKYPKMWLFRFTQSQFDFLINEALIDGVKANTNIVVFGHCPLTQEIGDREVMAGLLSAYKNKTTYSGIYEGTALGGAKYTNLADPTSDEWLTDYRISSSDIASETGTTVSNPIYCTTGDVIRIKGATFRSSQDRIGSWTANGNIYGNGTNYVSVGTTDYFEVNQVDDIYEFTVLNPQDVEYGYVRFAFQTPDNPEDIVITLNEEIIETEHGYDYVSVDADFTEAKGELVGYFAGHVHADTVKTDYDFPVITVRCDAKEENDADLYSEKVAGTITEQSFDVFTINTAERKIYATKIGAGEDRGKDTAITY